ncbi:hypothetical protein J2T17_000383 [Paenibacillus mucilaginosus]|uniref:hypothetical protein n=1 Tax=Paenibacillus mucilaginosus TaxID=61624 RepID=UPI003D1EB15A
MNEQTQALPGSLTGHERVVLDVFTRHPYLTGEQDLYLISRVTGLSVIQVELAVRSLRHKDKLPGPPSE